MMGGSQKALLLRLLREHPGASPEELAMLAAREMEARGGAPPPSDAQKELLLRLMHEHPGATPEHLARLAAREMQASQEAQPQRPPTDAPGLPTAAEQEAVLMELMRAHPGASPEEIAALASRVFMERQGAAPHESERRKELLLRLMHEHPGASAEELAAIAAEHAGAAGRPAPEARRVHFGAETRGGAAERAPAQPPAQGGAGLSDLIQAHPGRNASELAMLAAQRVAQSARQGLEDKAGAARLSMLLQAGAGAPQSLAVGAVQRELAAGARPAAGVDGAQSDAMAAFAKINDGEYPNGVIQGSLGRGRSWACGMNSCAG
ncbi:hypothetical protein M885DRAFT_551962 [Pelagophyceae sp. CCMP2097]|nr:hypothetical protein M885DRAFT_551962 [Pelagophyceae sp. CCMP2097]